MKNNVEVTKRDCLGCGQEFDSRTFIVLGIRMNFDRGYCPACRDKKSAEEQAREEMARLATVARKRREWRYSCGIPERFMDKQFETFKKERQPRAFKKCFEYAEKYPLSGFVGYSSLLLFSPPTKDLSGNDPTKDFSGNGVGKTHLVGSIAHRILNRWVGEERASCPVLFTTEPDLFRRIQATYNIPPAEKASHETEDDVFKHLTRVPLLILDDIGKEDRADPRFIQKSLFAIIDGRYKLALPMVLTTNLSLEQLSGHLGGKRGNEASYDRLVEMCQGKFIQFKGESYRRLKSGA